jgi:hypothetical protein
VGEVKKEVEGEENFQLLAALRSFQRRQRFHPVIGLLVDPRNISLFFPQPKTDKTATQYRIVTSTTNNFREVCSGGTGGGIGGDGSGSGGTRRCGGGRVSARYSPRNSQARAENGVEALCPRRGSSNFKGIHHLCPSAWPHSSSSSSS